MGRYPSALADTSVAVRGRSRSGRRGCSGGGTSLRSGCSGGLPVDCTGGVRVHRRKLVRCGGYVPVTIYPDLRFIHAGGDGGPRPSTTVVVIHATDDTGNALAEARYAIDRPDKTSAHFYSDETQVIQALDTTHIAYGCLYHGNHISIQFELCGPSNRLTDATLRRVAPIVARVCRDWGIPVRKIGPRDVAAGVKGICGHADITLAFPQDNGDHTDPGAQFPWATFIRYVQGVDMEQTDALVSKTNAPGRTVGQALADMSDLRDYLIGAGAAVPGDGSWPKPDSPLAKMLAAAG